MALPAVKSLADCLDLDKAVLDYLPQLYELPRQVPQALSSGSGLVALYASTNPLISNLALSFVLFAVFLVVSEVNRNYSQVDRLWSILPSVFIGNYALFAHVAGEPSARIDLAWACSAIWSTRLTFNYWRRGGYQVGSEDYRWEVVQNYLGPVLFFLFNVVFISTLQVVLLLCISLPAYLLLLVSRINPSLEAADYGFAALLVTLVAITAVGDQQQWSYQTAKYSYLDNARVPRGYQAVDLDLGFRTSGLWRYSRHPNFAAEQAVWVSHYVWSCVMTKSLINWSGVGAIGYLFLFQASTWFTELLTKRKYPEYADYQRQVGMFLPFITGGWRWQGPKQGMVMRSGKKKN